MLVFGPLSSVFDFLTFGLLFGWMQARPALFHTCWFIESILSAALVVFALRTRQVFLHSQPSRVMLAVTGLVALAALALPYAPLAGLMGFSPLPVPYLLAIFAIVAVYFASAELFKRWFYRRYQP